ncbi:hypothetical protein [Caldithrix abyssi]
MPEVKDKNFFDLEQTIKQLTKAEHPQPKNLSKDYFAIKKKSLIYFSPKGEKNPQSTPGT